MFLVTYNEVILLTASAFSPLCRTDFYYFYLTISEDFLTKEEWCPNVLHLLFYELLGWIVMGCWVKYFKDVGLVFVEEKLFCTKRKGKKIFCTRSACILMETCSWHYHVGFWCRFEWVWILFCICWKNKCLFCMVRISPAQFKFLKLKTAQSVRIVSQVSGLSREKGSMSQLPKKFTPEFETFWRSFCPNLIWHALKHLPIFPHSFAPAINFRC